MNLQEGLTLPIGWVNQSNKCTIVVCKLDNVSSPVVVQHLLSLYQKHQKDLTTQMKLKWEHSY